MGTNTLVNSLGLIFDIGGAILIWIFALPKNISREGESAIIAEQTDESEKAKAKKYDQFGGFGMFLLILGFVLQLASNFI